MSVTQLIGALAPAYTGDSRIPVFTTLATQQTSRSHFGVNYELAVALRVCHMLARNPSSAPGSAGAVISKREGEIAESYQVSSGMQKKYGDLCSTPYGAQLADLIEGNILGNLVAADPTAGILITGQGNSI